MIEAHASGNDVHSMTEMKINRTWSAASSVGALVRVAATVALMLYGYCPVPLEHAATRRDEAAAVGTPA